MRRVSQAGFLAVAGEGGRDGTSAVRVVTAALVVIGDEILSGRTKDQNIGYLAERATALGIELREVRVVPDVEAEIVAAINALRARYDHVFTTGGIGPTHDDITADAVAKAFGVAIDVDPRAVALLRERIPERDLNAARLRMARIPAGAELIENSVSKAPGFSLGNVHVMAGVPAIMRAMFEALSPRLDKGTLIASRSIEARLKEGDFATPLGEIQREFPDVTIGSYPSFDERTGFQTTVVLRSRSEPRLSAADAAVRNMLDAVRARLKG
jgi:molybdenum cofactor synthesis domain-containing protein